MTKLRNKTAAVADAMATVSLFLEGQADSFTTVCGCKFEVDVIKDNFTPLSKLLDEALDCIREDWNTIIPNDMLLDEVRKAIDACSSLQKNRTFRFLLRSIWILLPEIRFVLLDQIF